MKQILTLTAAAAASVVLVACGGGDAPTETTPPEVVAPEAPSVEAPTNLEGVAAGSYSLEKTHAFLTAYVGHATGISDYRISLTDFDAKLDFDPANPAASTLEVSINPIGVETNYPGNYKEGHADTGFETWNEHISRDATLLNADAHSAITFTATSIGLSGGNAGQVTGDLSFLGVTKPVTLDVTYNGTGNAPWFGERDLIGFDAKTTLNRSDFGMGALIPIVTDEVTIEFSGEFLQDE